MPVISFCWIQCMFKWLMIFQTQGVSKSEIKHCNSQWLWSPCIRLGTMSDFKALFKLPDFVMFFQGCEGCCSHNINKRLLLQFPPLLVKLWMAPERNGSAAPHSTGFSQPTGLHSFCMRSNNIGCNISHTMANLVIFIVFSFPPTLLPSVAIRSLIWAEYLGSQETTQLSPIQERWREAREGLLLPERATLGQAEHKTAPQTVPCLPVSSTS